ncbi:MAG: protein kinase [Planctomycetaceae bacterium]
MQPDQLEHPADAALQAFALGKAGEDELDSIQSHLRECPSCCERLESIGDDTFVALLRDVDTVPDEKTQALSVDDPPKSVVETVPAEEATTDGRLGAETPMVTKNRPASGFADAATIPPSVVSNVADIPGDDAPTAAYAADLDDGTTPAALFHHPRFEVQELIGQGGMGAVYKAEHRHMKRTVALKVINPKLVAGRTAVERFRREVEAAARLHHPNIVTAFDAELAGDAHFLVMEYVPGTDLHDVLQERGPLPVVEACDYIRQAALGLQCAHENGMVHRDIKPQNLMLTPDGQVKILDFGLASLTAEVVPPETIADDTDAADSSEHQHSSLTQAGSIMGTPDYMAPEQARDAHAADIRADIYSLGCTLYTLLTGKAPFTGGTAVDKIVAHAEHAPEPVESLRNDVPKELRRVLSRMLAKDPAERFQTPAEVAKALATLSDPDTAPVGQSASPLFRVTVAGWMIASVVLATRIFAVGFALGVLGLILLAVRAFLSRKQHHAGGSTTRKVKPWSAHDRFAVATIALTWACSLLAFAELSLPYIGVIWFLGLCIGFGLTRWVTANQPPGQHSAIGWLAWAGTVAFAGVIWVTTDKGQLKIDSQVDDVKIVVSKNGEEVEVLDLKTGTTLKRLPSGDYRIAVKGNRNDVKLSKGRVTISRWGKTIVTLTSVPLPTVIEVDRTDFNRVVAAGRGKLTPRMKQQLQAEGHPVLGQLADPQTKPIIELFATLPDDAHQRLLKDGYLKWKYASLDVVRQKVFHGNIKGKIDLAKQRGVPIPATISLEALKKADVGFAVVKIPALKTAVVSWYVLLPEYPQPMWVTVVGSQATGKQPYFVAHHEQLPKLRLKGHSKAIEATPSALADSLKVFREQAVRIIKSGSHMSFSPDGNYVAFTRPNGKMEVMNLATGKTRLLADSGFAPTWSPDGTLIVYEHVPNGLDKRQASKSGKLEIWVLPAAGGKKRRLVQGSYPSWHADSKRIYFQRHKERMIHVVATDDPGAKSKPHAPCPAFYPAVAPDGSQIAYVLANEIRIVNVKTKKTVFRWRTPMPVRGGICRWSPDGREISVGPYNQSYPGLWIVDVAGKTVRKVAGAPAVMALRSRDRSRMALVLRQPVTETWIIDSKPDKSSADSLAAIRAEAKPDLDRLQKTAEAWLKLMDDGKYGDAWEQSAGPNKKGISKADMAKLYTQMAAKLGKVTSRKLFSRDYVTELPGFPKGRYVLIKYLTDFDKQKDLVQSVLLIPENGSWKVQAHVLLPKDQLPAPKKKQAHPTDYDRLTGTWVPVDATFSGKKLTKEQRLQTRFKFDGDRVELTIPMSPTIKTRYALRQTAKPKWIEIINPNPKKNGEPNIAGIYEFDGDKLKIAFGDADHARPRDFEPLKRQDHFTGTFIRTNRPKTAELKVLDRYNGSWEQKLTENSTRQFTRKVTSRHRVRNTWIMNAHFQRSYFSSIENDEEWLTVRTWDKHRGTYRHFLFGSTGSFFERRSRWDEKSTTMRYTIVPPARGVTGTATDVFVNETTMTSALRVKDGRGELTRNVDGVAHRTLAAAPAEPKVAQGPAAGSNELAWLGKFAGRWNLRHEMRKSVVVPRPFTQQMTETVEWILGGRFLRARVVDRFGRLFAMHIMTWDSRAKTYRIWHFEQDGTIGLWKGTRDDKRRTFDWQALDTPPGWIGTLGSCQIVDENKTILSIRIKDAQDRVLMDMRQTRTRMNSKK